MELWSMVARVWVPLLVLLSGCCFVVVQAQTLDILIQGNAELSLFALYVEQIDNLASLTNDTNGQTTVFAPTDRAINASSKAAQFWNPSFWVQHLNATLQSHFVDGLVLTSRALFDGRTSVEAVDGYQLQLYPETSKIENASIVTADLKADNGILHIIDNVLPSSIDANSLADLESQPDFAFSPGTNGVSLLQVVDFANGRQDLETVRDAGSTFLGCSVDALNGIDDYMTQTINGASSFLRGELMNVSMQQNTLYEFVQFNLLKSNFYFDDLDDGLLALSLPVGACAHIWVTKRDGKLCFNDGCVVMSNAENPVPRSFLASNGVGYVIDKCLICPGIGQIVSLANDLTDLDIGATTKFFKLATELNLRDLRLNLGTGGPLTLFASIESGWTSLGLQQLARLQSPVWKAHRLDLLKSMLVQGLFSSKDLIRIYQEEQGPFNLTTLNGEVLLIDYNAEMKSLFIGEGEMYLVNVQGYDGILHLTNHTPSPRSLKRTLWEVGNEEPDFSRQMSLINQNAALATTLRLVGPTTVFFANNEAWAGKRLDSADLTNTVLNWHFFSSLYTCQDLINLNGQTIVSLNNATWTVSVNTENNKPCLMSTTSSTDSAEPTTTACIYKCDYIAKNGLAHGLDNMLLIPGMVTEAPPTVAPSMAPTQTASPTITSQPTLSPTALLVDFNLNQCTGALQAADLDEDGAIRRPEFYQFLKNYSQLLCQPALNNTLSPDQIALFMELACVCKIQQDAEDNCCQGTAAFIDLMGAVIPNQTEYQTEVCTRAIRELGGRSLCIPTGESLDGGNQTQGDVGTPDFVNPVPSTSTNNAPPSSSALMMNRVLHQINDILHVLLCFL